MCMPSELVMQFLNLLNGCWKLSGHARTTTRTCYFHTNLEAKKEEPDFKADVLDIEDLVVLGKKHSACPYFMTKEIRKAADIIFMPYNYLLDPKVRKIHNIELQVPLLI